MGYMSRLSLFGKGTYFPNGFTQFLEAFQSGGTGLMEILSVDLKRRGKYLSRTLSFSKCGFNVYEAHNPEMEKIWGEACGIWFKLFAFLTDQLSSEDSSASYLARFPDSMFSKVDKKDDKSPLFFPSTLQEKTKKTRIWTYFWYEFHDLVVTYYFIGHYVMSVFS